MMQRASRGRALAVGCALLLAQACSASGKKGDASTSPDPTPTDDSAGGAGGMADPTTTGGGEGGDLTVSVGSGGTVDPGPGDGETLWTRAYGGVDLDGGDVDVDSAGNAVVAGYFYDVGNAGGDDFSNAYPADLFVAKYDDNGDHLWSQALSGDGIAKARAVSVDASDNIWISGFFTGEAIFGGTTLSAVGERDVFVAKLDPAGTVDWAVRFGGAGNDAAYGIDVDSLGRATVVGYFSGDVAFDDVTLASAGGSDGFAVKLDGSGSVLTATAIAGSGQEVAFGVAVGPDDEVAVTGHCASACSVGGLAATGAPGKSMFVAKLDATATAQWAARYGGFGRAVGNAVSISGDGDIAVGGYYVGGQADFGSGAPSANAGERDGVVAVYLGADGAHQWSTTFGGSARDEVRDVSFDALGDLVVTGYVTGTVDLGQAPAQGGASLDAFVSKLAAGGGQFKWSKRFDGKDWDQGLGAAIDSTTSAAVVLGVFSDTVDFGTGDLTSNGEEDLFLMRISAGEEITPR